jgi:hypothetical protein
MILNLNLKYPDSGIYVVLTLSLNAIIGIIKCFFVTIIKGIF